MTRLTMKVAGTNRIAAVAIGVTIPKKTTKLIAAKTAKTARTISTARIRATSRTPVHRGGGRTPSDDLRSCRISEVSPPVGLFVARESPP